MVFTLREVPKISEEKKSLLINVGNLLTIYRGLSGPLGPKPRESLKRVSLSLRPETPVDGQRVHKVSAENVFREPSSGHF